MTAIDNKTSHRTQTNWPVINKAKRFIIDEKDTTLKIIKLLSSIIIFPLAFILDLTIKGTKASWTKFSEYISKSLAKEKGPPKKSLIQKITNIYFNHKRMILTMSEIAIISVCIIFPYYNRPLIPNEYLAKENEDKLVKIANILDALTNCIKSIQDGIIPHKEKTLELLKKVNVNNKARPLVGNDESFKELPSFAEVNQLDDELNQLRGWEILKCYQNSLPEIEKHLHPIREGNTYFQGTFV